MDAGPIRDALTVVAGVGTGVLSAAFGVGGAVVSTPAIRALGATALSAVGTTLPSVLPSAASGTARYLREGLVARRIVAWTAPPGVVASVCGALLSRVIPGNGHLLMLLTASLLGFTAIRMARPPVDRAAVDAEAAAEAEPSLADDAPRPVTAPDRVEAKMLLGIGVVAGLMSGLLGVGGGIVMVPAFTELAKLPLKTAIATSLACVGVFAIPGTITHAALGGIDWRFALLLAVGVVPGARLGASLVVKAADHRLRVVVASFLGAIAIFYAGGELLALR